MNAEIVSRNLLNSKLADLKIKNALSTCYSTKSPIDPKSIKYRITFTRPQSSSMVLCKLVLSLNGVDHIFAGGLGQNQEKAFHFAIDTVVDLLTDSTMEPVNDY